MRQTTQTHTRLLDAATKTLLAHGTTGLTLDAVAKEARVSKGGLLHHFPSKDALIEAIMQKLFADFTALVQRYYEHEPERPGRWLRAYVRASFAKEAEVPLGLVLMLAWAIFENGKLLRMVQDDLMQWQERLVSDGIPATRATVIRHAADAQWPEQMLGITPDDSPQREAIMEELLRLVDTP